MSRSYHLALPDWEGDLDEIHESVVADLLHGPRFMQVALELWHLADRQDRVESIRAILEIAHTREILFLRVEEVSQLDALLEGLDEAVQSALSLDEHLQIPLNRLEELRLRTKLLNLEARGDQIPADGVAASVTEVYELRGFLQQAINRRLNLMLD